MKPKAIIVSGYFNPIHKGHIEYFNNFIAEVPIFIELWRENTAGLGDKIQSSSWLLK
jgi:hypothetical protein